MYVHNMGKWSVLNWRTGAGHTQGVCPQLREKGRTLTDTYAYITQSVKYNNLTRVMYENYFSSIFFSPSPFWWIFDISLHYVSMGPFLSLPGLGCAFLNETLSMRVGKNYLRVSWIVCRVKKEHCVWMGKWGKRKKSRCPEKRHTLRLPTSLAPRKKLLRRREDR